VARLTNASQGIKPELDEMDKALEDLLRDDGTDRPVEE